MGCIDIGYCAYDICGMDSICGYVFMAMCMDVFMDMCLRIWVSGFVLWLCVYGYVYGCVWVCVSGYVYGYRVSILRETRFNKYRGLPLLGARFHHYRDLLSHEAHFNKFWVLLLHEAHFNKFWVLRLHEAHLDDSSNFSDFFSTKMEKFAPVCSVE